MTVVSFVNFMWFTRLPEEGADIRAMRRGS
jgi:hypothetical protein